MATNTGENFRRGSVRNRAQMEHPNGGYLKRDTETGRFMAYKADGPFKGVAQEQDGRKKR